MLLHVSVQTQLKVCIRFMVVGLPGLIRYRPRTDRVLTGPTQHLMPLRDQFDYRENSLLLLVLAPGKLEPG